MLRHVTSGDESMVKLEVCSVGLACCLLLTSAGVGAATVPAERTGVVVEEVGEGSALATAGLRPGDVVFAWERLPNPPANPHGAQGRIESVFDWMWLEVEQAPRGIVKLTGQRGGEVKVLAVMPGEWKATLRTRMPEGMLEDYEKGKELIEAEEIEAGLDLWQKIAVAAKSEGADRRLTCWLLLRIGDAWGKARQWEKAHGVYHSALEEAQAPLTRVAIWQTIGYTYRKASEFDAAREAYTSAQEIKERVWGETLFFAKGLDFLGGLDQRQGRFDSAQNHLQRALEIRQKLVPSSLEVAKSLNNLGTLALQRGDLDRANEYYEESLRIFQKLTPDSLYVAKTLSNLGNLARQRADLDRAAEYYEKSLEMFQKVTPGSLYVAASLEHLGVLADDRGDFGRTTSYYERSLEIRQKLTPGSLSVAASLNNLGVLASKRGDLDRAHEYYKRSLEIRQLLTPDNLDVAASLNNLGILASKRGDLDRAYEYYKRSLGIRQKLVPDSFDVAKSLNNLGILASDRGDLVLAAEYHERSLKIQQKLAPDSLDLAYNLNNLGSLARQRGDLYHAAEYYERSLEIKKKLAPDSLDVAASLSNLGVLARQSGDLVLAAEYYGRSLEIKKKLAPNSLQLASTLSNLGILARQQGDLHRAAEYFEESLEIKQELAPGGLDVALSLNHMGTLASDRGDLNQATEYYERSLEIDQKLAPGSSAEAETLHDLATVRRKQNQLLPALALHLRSLQALENQIARLGGSPDVQAGFRAERVKFYRDTVDLAVEVGQLGQAFHTLERFRARIFLNQLAERDLMFSDIPEDLDRNRRRVAVRYDRIQQELAALNIPKNKEEIEELQGKLRRLQWDRDAIEEEIRRDYPNLAALQYPQPLELQAAQQILDPGTLMLSYSVGEKGGLLFVVSKNHPLKVYELPMGEEELRHQVEDFQIKTHRRGWDRRAASRLELANFLYNTLIEPAEDAIQQSERLLIIPDGPLHLLPFAALVRKTEAHEEKPWQYLVEWKPVHSVLSATVYAELKKLRRTRQPVAETPIALAAFGDPLYPQELQLENLEDGAEPIQIGSLSNVPDVYVRSAAERGSRFPPLPYTRQEVQQIASLYLSAQTYLGADATEERAKSIGKDIRILHFATHSTLDDRFPLNSAVVLTIPEELGEGRENGLLQAWEIFERVRIDADLVVLSACESGLGKELGGEGLIGLTRAFQYAGARTVAASLWKVPDRTTAVLMERFYRHLKEGKPKDEALRAAQLELIRGPIELQAEGGQVEMKDASAPYYWAAFQIYGDWR